MFLKKIRPSWQNLENIFKKLKNHFYCFLEKHIIDVFSKNTFRDNISVKNTSNRNTTKRTISLIFEMLEDQSCLFRTIILRRNTMVNCNR